jgi:hypothetical protein
VRTLSNKNYFNFAPHTTVKMKTKMKITVVMVVAVAAEHQTQTIAGTSIFDFIRAQRT